jgi:DNA adenine methylase
MRTQLLSWRGSKFKDLDRIKPIVSTQRYTRLVEPFCGSASVFFGLEPKSALLNDIDTEVVMFFSILKTDCEAVLEHLPEIPAVQQGRISYSQFQDLKENWNPTEPADWAAKYFVMNRASYWGKGETFGGIKYPYHKEKLTHMYSTSLARERLSAASKVLQAAEFMGTSFERVFDEVRKGDFVFVDPPYFEDIMFSDNKQCYGDYFDGHHILSHCLADCLDKGAHFLMTINAHEKVEELYPWANIVKVRWQHKRNRHPDERSEEFYVTSFGWDERLARKKDMPVTVELFT